MRVPALIIASFFSGLITAQDTIVPLESLMNGTHQLESGAITNIWGYTIHSDDGSAPLELPAPYLRFIEGDSVHITMQNPSMEGHTIHLHGLDVDQANDGVPATSDFVLTGDTGIYRFKVDKPGNYIYHCHVTSTLHVTLGMYGMLVVKPASDTMTVWSGGPSFTKEYSYLISDMDKSWNDDYTTTGGLNTFDPDHFLLNGKSGTQIYQDTNMTISASAGDTVLLRLANIGFSISKFIFPADLNARIVTTDGRPLATEELSDTLRLYPGERYSALFTPPPGFQGYILVDHLHMYGDELMGSNSIPINTSAVYGINEGQFLNGYFSISPNPTNGELRIHLCKDTWSNGRQKVELTILNTKGQVVRTESVEQGQHTVHLDLEDLNAGVYYVQLSDHRHHLSATKLIVQ